MSLYSRLLPYVLGASILSGCSFVNQFDLVVWADTTNPEKYRRVILGNKRVETDSEAKDFNFEDKNFEIKNGVLYMENSEVSKLPKDSRLLLKPKDQGIVVYVLDKEKKVLSTIELDSRLEEIASSD